MKTVTPPTVPIAREPEQITSFRIRVARDLADFADIWPTTKRSGSARNYVFQCADILRIWCKTIGKARGTHTLFVAVLNEIEKPILLLPFGIEKQHGIRILRFLDGGVCDYNAPIVFEPGVTWTRQAEKQMWQELIKALPRFDIAIFDKMPAEVCGIANPFANFGVPVPPSGHLVNIRSSWDEYAAKKLPYKRETSYQRRRLTKIGHVAFKIAQTPVDRQHALETMMNQKSRRYIETRGVDGFDRPGYREYYKEITECFSWPGPLLISTLAVGDEVLATNWGLIFDNRFLGIVMSFEGGKWKSFSPGRILLEDLLKWNFTNGTAIFDFGIGDEDYKVAYTDHTLELYKARIPVTAIGKACEVARNTKVWNLLKAVSARVSAKAN